MGVREKGENWIRIHLGPWIRKQRYKMKGKAKFNQQIFWGFLVGNYIFFKSATKKVAYLIGLGRDLKIFFFFTFKRLFEIKLVILMSWIRIRIRNDQISWINITK